MYDSCLKSEKYKGWIKRQDQDFFSFVFLAWPVSHRKQYILKYVTGAAGRRRESVRKRIETIRNRII